MNFHFHIYKVLDNFEVKMKCIDVGAEKETEARHVAMTHLKDLTGWSPPDIKGIVTIPGERNPMTVCSTEVSRLRRYDQIREIIRKAQADEHRQN